MNAKLGIKVVKSSAGFAEIFTRNVDPSWVGLVKDIREDLKLLPNLAETESASAIMYTAHTEGEFYTIVTADHESQADFITAWVYVPRLLNITGRELAAALEVTRDEMLSVAPDIERLADLFDTEYGYDETVRTLVPTSGSVYGLRYYGEGTKYSYSLENICNIGMSQPGNTRYRTIFLVNNADELRMLGCADLSGVALRETFNVMPPAPVEGFFPYLDDKKPFDKPVRVTSGEKVTVLWKQKGFATVRKETIITDATSTVASITEKDFRKRISFNDITVLSQNGNQITDDCIISVNGQQLNEDTRQVYVPCDALESVPVIVSCRGYKSCEQKMDFTDGTRKTITLEEQAYTFILPLDDNLGTAEVCIPTARKIEHSPIRGYRCDKESGPERGRENMLKFEGGTKSSIPSFLALALGLVIGAGVTWLLMSNNEPAPRHEAAEKEIAVVEERVKEPVVEEVIEEEPAEVEEVTEEVKEEVKEEPAQKPAATAANSVSAAVEYLSGHKVWNREEMEAIPALAGLWDALNERNFAVIKSFSSKFSGVEDFGKLLDAIKKLESSGGGTSDFKHKYTESDHDITIKGYIDKVAGKANDRIKAGLKAK
ncbi:MAG: hypothetical protein MJY60_04310 [Bacteroidales bacterium]|nr:hypothetical protein [Bacteroidales bacterium]